MLIISKSQLRSSIANLRAYNENERTRSPFYSLNLESGNYVKKYRIWNNYFRDLTVLVLGSLAGAGCSPDFWFITPKRLRGQKRNTAGPIKFSLGRKPNNSAKSVIALAT